MSVLWKDQAGTWPILFYVHLLNGLLHNYELEMMKDVENIIPEYLTFVFIHLKAYYNFNTFYYYWYILQVSRSTNKVKAEESVNLNNPFDWTYPEQIDISFLKTANEKQFFDHLSHDDKKIEKIKYSWLANWCMWTDLDC